MLQNLNQKHILVLGASSSIGLATCALLAERGAVLTAQGNTAFGKIPQSYNPIQFEFTTGNCADFAAQLGEAPFDGVVCLLGKTDFTFFSNMTEPAWSSVLNANLTVPALALASVQDRLVEKSSVVLCSSALADLGENGMSHYAAAKAGLEGLMRSLAKEWANRKIRVNAVSPHLIETENTRQLPAKKKEAFKKKTLLGQLGEASDVAEAIAYLLSDASKFATGQILRLNGGSYLS